MIGHNLPKCHVLWPNVSRFFYFYIYSTFSILFPSLYQTPIYLAFQLSPTNIYQEPMWETVWQTLDTGQKGLSAPPQGLHDHRSTGLRRATWLTTDHSTAHKFCRSDLALTILLVKKNPHLELILGWHVFWTLSLSYSEDNSMNFWHQSPSQTVEFFSSVPLSIHPEMLHFLLPEDTDIFLTLFYIIRYPYTTTTLGPKTNNKFWHFALPKITR